MACGRADIARPTPRPRNRTVSRAEPGCAPPRIGHPETVSESPRSGIEKAGIVDNFQIDCFLPPGPDEAEGSLILDLALPVAEQARISASTPARSRPGTTPASAGTSTARGMAIEPLGLVRALRRRLFRATVFGLLVGALASLATWAIVPPAKYTATARLHVASAPPLFMYKTREATPDFPTFRQNQLALLKSQQVIDTALAKEDVKSLRSLQAKPDPAEWVQEQLTIAFSTGSEILEISMSGDDPATVATIVN